MAEPFNIEEWLNSKKTGFSGKIPRADFIAKLKDLVEEINQLTNQNQELDQKLATSQTNLTNRDQIIKDNNKEIDSLKTTLNNTEQKNNEYKENISNLQTKTEEQYKTIEDLQKQAKNKEDLLSDLKSRPNITEKEYQQLLNNQERHKTEELRPDDLPDDWEKQLADKKELEENFADLEKKLSTAEEKILELSEKQKNISEVESKLAELEKRPTAEQLQQAIQQEAKKYKDYDLIKTDLEKWKDSYSKIKEKYETLQAKESNSPPPIVSMNEEIIKKVGEIINSAINSLKQEIRQWANQSANSQLNNSPAELPADYEELKASKEKLLRALGILGSKIN